MKYTSISGKGGDNWSERRSSWIEIFTSAGSWPCCYKVKEETGEEIKRERLIQTSLADHIPQGSYRPNFHMLKNCFRVTVGVLWTLTLVPMEDIWPPVQRTRPLWFGAPSKFPGRNSMWHEIIFSATTHPIHVLQGIFCKRAQTPSLQCGVWPRPFCQVAFYPLFAFHFWPYPGGVQTPRLLSSRRQCRIARRSLTFSKL